ncbi:hypothetical protein BGZ96_003622 [Linnemannia gamsii]|uniref:Uncharacterized protein n=1 Tax=Linnemannia gamsii TaxID=64522 RepID=A0ABQ7JJ20_9FUNG|nr:hypothetical protein BGZ96_003622 [Linnemannia gamsii]
MDDLDMEENFDFGGLTLGEFPRTSATPSAEVSHLSDSLSAASLSDQSSAAQAQALVSSTNSSSALTTVTTPNSREGGDGGGEGTTPDNGPWAKLPSAGSEDFNPYLPGVTAQKLDAMAMDPHHVFRSAPPQSGDSPFSIPPPSSATHSQDEQQQKDKDKDRKQDDKTDKNKDKIPDWMLADPELKPTTTDIGWGTTTTASSSTQKDDSLGWGDPGTFGGFGYSGADLSTTVDSNALFGFSSYPTYENLSFANAIADEQHRKNTLLASGDTYDAFLSSSSLSDGQTRTTREGGFARFGNTVRGDGQIAPVFGRRPSSSLGGSGSSSSGEAAAMIDSNNNDHGFTWDNRNQRKSVTASSQQQEQQPQWQWRSSGPSRGLPGLDQLMDEDLDEDPFDEPEIK